MTTHVTKPGKPFVNRCGAKDGLTILWECIDHPMFQATYDCSACQAAVAREQEDAENNPRE